MDENAVELNTESPLLNAAKEAAVKATVTVIVTVALTAAAGVVIEKVKKRRAQAALAKERLES